ncbi:hypothetical protein RFI_33890, partial [Reticulomyxa filosa]
NIDSLLSDNGDTGGVFAYNSITWQMRDKACDQLRKLVDVCDNVTGFMMTHSIGGGTGSGLCSYMLMRMSVDYKKKTNVCYSIYPSNILSTSIVEPYNALLAMYSLSYSSNITLAFDNEAIYNICQRNLHIAKPDVNNINRLIAKVISSVTAPFRFDGELHTNLNELQASLIPFPSLQFITTGMSPIVPKMDVTTTLNDVQTITNECLNPTN